MAHTELEGLGGGWGIITKEALFIVQGRSVILLPLCFERFPSSLLPLICILGMFELVWYVCKLMSEWELGLLNTTPPPAHHTHMHTAVDSGALIQYGAADRVFSALESYHGNCDLVATGLWVITNLARIGGL